MGAGSQGGCPQEHIMMCFVVLFLVISKFCLKNRSPWEQQQSSRMEKAVQTVSPPRSPGGWRALARLTLPSSLPLCLSHLLRACTWALRTQPATARLDKADVSHEAPPSMSSFPFQTPGRGARARRDRGVSPE